MSGKRDGHKPESLQGRSYSLLLIFILPVLGLNVTHLFLSLIFLSFLVPAVGNAVLNNEI